MRPSSSCLLVLGACALLACGDDTSAAGAGGSGTTASSSTAQSAGSSGSTGAGGDSGAGGDTGSGGQPGVGGQGGEAAGGGAGSTGTGGSAGTCGNGDLEGDEACDDANSSDTDGCTTDCTIAACGDGFVHAGVEACDDGDLDEGDGCSARCILEQCGNALLQAGEECDDGNVLNDDACPTTCAAAACGDGFVRAGVEQCDDANDIEDDGCTSECVRVGCGDGVLQAGEECDDAGNVDGDLCSSACTNEYKLAFVSSQLYSGNMGGLAGADALCQSHADAGGLPGNYLAWLSTTTTSPSVRFVQSPYPYLTVFGTVIADNWADLVDGALDSPLDVTELGSPAPIGNTGCAGGGFATVWSNTNSNGTLGFDQYSCGDWTSTVNSSGWGNANDPSSAWTAWCSGGTCGWTSALYCFQQ